MWQGLVMTTLRQRVGARRWRFIVPGAILVALVSAGIIVIGNETSDPAGPSLAAALEIVCSPGTRSADTGPLTGTVAGGNCRSKVDPGVPLYYASIWRPQRCETPWAVAQACSRRPTYPTTPTRR